MVRGKGIPVSPTWPMFTPPTPFDGEKVPVAATTSRFVLFPSRNLTPDIKKIQKNFLAKAIWPHLYLWVAMPDQEPPPVPLMPSAMRQTAYQCILRQG
jgi:hypothetical protein